MNGSENVALKRMLKGVRKDSKDSGDQKQDKHNMKISQVLQKK